MKKNVLNKMEKINEERKMSKEVEKKITERIIANASICISLTILIFTIKIISKFLSREISLIITNLFASIFLIFAIIMFEIAYKKDSGKLAISSVELLFISLFVLFSQYINLKLNRNAINMILIIFNIYYIVKIIAIYNQGKKKYLKNISDINDIIKKESKDKLLEKFRTEEEEKKKRTKKNTKSKTSKKQTQKKKTTKTNKNTTKKKSTINKSKE